MVEHDPDVVAVADHVIDMGSDAGTGGGHVVYSGDVAGLSRAETLTGRYFSRGTRLKETVHTATGALPVVDTNAHNLTGITVDVPAGVLTVVTGVAGSGKSTLVHDGFLVIGRADWVIDLGPEGGHEGGRVVFQGPPRELLDAPGSHTAEYLRRAVRPAVSAG